NTNQTTEITHLLPSIIAPTLLIWGEDDPFQPISYGARLASDIPNSRLIRVQEANHYVMHDQPELVAGAIAEFLDTERKKFKGT
ncbi:MAG: alpha/beta hydrolase, partial [Chloroflexia bacterium]